jgi:hypothetical protein
VVTGTAAAPVVCKAVTTMRTFTILLLAISLAACSAEVWRKSGASEQDVRVDTMACQSAAQRSSAGTNPVYAHVESYNYFNNCMTDRGYLVSIF